MTREQYLENQWIKYPAMPEKSLCFGRIQDLSAGKIELHRQNKIFSEDIDLSLTPQKFFSVGDLVAKTAKQEWILLAPSRSLKSQTKSDSVIQMKVQKAHPELLKLWSLYLNKVREFFTSLDFIEVQTPSLVVCPGTEPALEAFQTEFVFGSHRQKLYLPTSPELNLKKVLAAGFENIFEMRSCFRNGEITERHQPEFMMIEWYRAFSSLDQIRQDVVALIQFLGSQNDLVQQFKKCQLDGTELNQPETISIKSIQELFLKQNIDLNPSMTLQDYQKILQGTKLQVHGELTLDDCFFLLMGELIEPHLNSKDLVFVEQYPPFQAALARINEQGWGERFEVYWEGLEIANAFHELNDPDLQRAQALGDLNKKNSEGKTSIPLDEDFFQALDSGMPPSGGIALGLDRLFMALFQFDDIRVGKMFSYNYSTK